MGFVFISYAYHFRISKITKSQLICDEISTDFHLSKTRMAICKVSHKMESLKKKLTSPCQEVKMAKM